MNGKWGTMLLPAIVVIVLDQLTKMMVVGRLQLHQSISVVDGLFAFTYVRNTGAAFGIFAGHFAQFRVPMLLAIALIALLVLLWFVRGIPADRRLVIAACGGVLGGAIGNMIDRAIYGEVIDFLDVYVGAYHWPAFNVADAAITVGVIVLCLDALRGAPAPEHSAT
jgi:signal peptidase II